MKKFFKSILLFLKYHLLAALLSFTIALMLAFEFKDSQEGKIYSIIISILFFTLPLIVILLIEYFRYKKNLDAQNSEEKKLKFKEIIKIKIIAFFLALGILVLAITIFATIIIKLEL